MNDEDGLKLEWFGGNQAALDACNMILRISHVWDDVVDKDTEVSEKAINQAFLDALVYLPLNPFYRAIQIEIAPLWLTVVSAYEAANFFEREKDPYGLELSFMLRCAMGNIIAYAMQICIGADKMREVAPVFWKTLVGERFDDYRKEHLNEC